jgi:hypothetical protein
MQKPWQADQKPSKEEPPPLAKKLNPGVFVPDPLSGEGFKLPLPRSNQYIRDLNFGAEGGDGAPMPPGGGGSGDGGLGTLTEFYTKQSESECTVCEGTKTITGFAQGAIVRDTAECPMCLGKGVLGALRKATPFEAEEIGTLFGSLAFTSATPLIVQEGRWTTVFLRRMSGIMGLRLRGGILVEQEDDHNLVSFLLACVSNVSDRAKLDLGLDHEFGILSRMNLLTVEAEKSGDVILTIRGLSNDFALLRLEVTRKSSGVKKRRFGSPIHDLIRSWASRETWRTKKKKQSDDS